jgi:hypothetical protein
MHVILSHFGAIAFQTAELPGALWGYSVAFGAGELIVGFFMRMIHLEDHTTEKLEALRALRKEQIKKFYEGIPGPQQWEMSSLEPVEAKATEE